MILYKETLSEEDIKDLLEVFIVHHKLVNKVQPKDLGFVTRKMFQTHKNKVNEIKMRLDEK